MQNLTPCLWFDNEAEEAVKFYTSIFEDCSVKKVARFGKEGFEYLHKPEGSVMTVDFELNGQKFLALNGGPDYKFNESVSLFIYCGSEEGINFLYQKLTKGGSVNMPLDKYDWSPKYAWLKDKFGISWQVVPTILDELMKELQKASNVMNVIFKMKKFDISKLVEAANG